MKFSAFCLSVCFISFLGNNPIAVPFSKQLSQDSISFTLRFVTVGFGSNMFEMQPIFDIAGTKFVYTSEQVWVHPDTKKVERDTLLPGNFRTSSIDSISNLINVIKDSVVSKTNLRISSGAAISIEVSTQQKKILFSLHNASDPTAEQIVSILNSYIPDKFQKLSIPNFTKTIL